MSMVLGLDSGGTKTIAAVVDPSGRILRHWSGPGFDPLNGDGWTDGLASAAAFLCDGEQPAAAVLGLPVHGEVEAISDRQRAVASNVFSCPHLVLNDVEVAFDGAFVGDDGVLVLAGTGSMAWAKQGNESLRIGGWGNAFGDEGSAFWIGREALSLASQALDGRRNAADFAAAILASCGVDASGLIDWAYSRLNPRATFAALAETVSTLAGAGDATAIDLLVSAARSLGDHGVAARAKLGRPALAWSYGGGVFGSLLVLEQITHRLGPPVLPKLPPVGGAVWRSARLTGWDAGPEFISALANSLENLKTKKGN
jgi:N-acetylglucosamine kinase